MFQKVFFTKYPPSNTTIVYDGNCGFCKYWLTKWKKITKQEKLKISYKPFQDHYKEFPDIPKERFQEAAQLIDSDGKIFTGPHAAYRSLFLAKKFTFLEMLYAQHAWFTYLSDRIYSFIANHRSAFFTISKFLFGRNANKGFPFWLLYLMSVATIIFFLLTRT